MVASYAVPALPVDGYRARGQGCHLKAQCASAGVYRNLLIRFVNDSIDDTSELAGMLQSNSCISGQLDLSVSPSDRLTLTSLLATKSPSRSCCAVLIAVAVCI